MNRASWNLWMPMLLAAVFFAIPVILFFWSAPPLWAVTDNETAGFGNGLNLAYRLARPSDVSRARYESQYPLRVP
jgi:hypothetical protein